MRISVFDSNQDCYVTVDLPDEIVKKSMLKDMISDTECDDDEIIPLPREKITYGILLIAINEMAKQTFEKLLSQLIAYDFMGFCTRDLAHQIASCEDYNPERVGHLNFLILQSKCLTYKNYQKLYAYNKALMPRHLMFQTIYDQVSKYDISKITQYNILSVRNPNVAQLYHVLASPTKNFISFLEQMTKFNSCICVLRVANPIDIFNRIKDITIEGMEYKLFIDFHTAFPINTEGITLIITSFDYMSVCHSFIEYSYKYMYFSFYTNIEPELEI